MKDHKDFVTRKGRSYVSVTTVLKLINDEELNKARGFLGNREYEQRQKEGGDRGDAFHLYSAMIDQGKGMDIPWDELDEIVKANLLTFEAWQLNNVVKSIVIEKQFFSDTYLDHGTPDRVYLLRGRKIPDLIDFKTGKKLNMKKVRYQLSRYKEILKEKGIETMRKLVFHFREGALNIIPLDEKDHISDHVTYLYLKLAYLDYISK